MDLSAVKNDVGKPDITLIDPDFLVGLTAVLEHGVRKYGRDNWKGGLRFNRVLAAMMRHIGAIVKGEDFDEDSQLLHAFHVAAGAMFMSHYCVREEYRKFDDRAWDNSHGLSMVRDGTCENSESSSEPADVGREMFQRTEEIKEDAKKGGVSTEIKEGLKELDQELDKFEAALVELLRVIFDGECDDDNGGEDDVDVARFNGGPNKFSSTKRDIAELQADIADWADRLWPDRKPINALTKLQMEEIPELITGGIEASELADVGILLLDVAYLKGIDLGKAIEDKMRVNRSRKWEINPITGLAHHIE